MKTVTMRDDAPLRGPSTDPRIRPPIRTHAVTCCDRVDADLCALLCESMDDFVPAAIRHSIVVPSRDYRLFRPLATQRRDIVIAEDVLGPGFQQVPHESRQWLYQEHRLSGWSLQQLLKLSTPAFVQEDIVLHLDSEMWFVRPLEERRLVHGDRVRLYHRRDPRPNHEEWHRTAASLLGCEPTNYFGANFIAPAVTWRRATVVALHDHLQHQSGLPWQRVLATRRFWSEYTIYGVFVSVLGVDWEHHFLDSGTLCHTFWETTRGDGPGRNAEMEGFIHELRVHHIAVLVQSTVPLTLRERRDLYRKSSVIAGAPRLGWLAKRIADRARKQSPEFWGPWVALGARYLEHCSKLPASAGVLRRLAGLPSFLQREWGTIPLRRLPLVAAAKYRQWSRRRDDQPERMRGRAAQ